MIRIEELPNGVLAVHNDDGVSYTAHPERDLKKDIFDKLALLRATDEYTKVDAVGWHMQHNTYWVLEGGEDLDRLDELARHHNLKLMFKRYKPMLFGACANSYIFNFIRHAIWQR